MTTFQPSQYAQVEFSEDTDSKVVEFGATKITIQRKPSYEYDADYLAAVQLPGRELQMIPLAGHFRTETVSVRLLQLEPGDPGMSVMIESWTGGAHCCLVTSVVQPVTGGVRMVELPAEDAGGGFDEKPVDTNSDGYVDLITSDTRFLYAFSGYASSHSPPKILNVFRGNFIDVSGEPDFRDVFEKYASEMKVLCDGKSEDRNGACIAYLGAMARLGRLEEGFAHTDLMADNGARENFPVACLSPIENVYECPGYQRRSFAGFGEAARYFLKENGYTS